MSDRPLWWGSRVCVGIALYLLAFTGNELGVGSSSDVPYYALSAALFGVLGISGLVEEIKRAMK